MPTTKIKSSALAGLALASAVALAGCSSTANPPDTSMPPPVDCGAQALSGQTGQSVVGSTPQDVRVGGEPITVPGSLRVITPGMAVTQDFRADRLNLEVDASGNLVRAYCA
ncbi:I78 family peptidase inhibitor [Pelagibacterium sp. 26DY04]|uniref:I78 family peptidase inhibitor n=1 Tax=unclassified Pelagibacterium TaxID=2623280 RepID=UPI002814EF9B|nr:MULTISPECIES: I78 family peptidase inhibitor [unclassified Pelagibacterium]WMT88757.1 I78 family peptidase inhibitor [Pelagibacterium sp. 26DY04]WMT90586.1 I78 family peptidase inhibitor [Pelagibacterium sp. H642]